MGMKDGLTRKNLDVTDVTVKDDLSVVDDATLKGDTQIGDASADTATFYAGTTTSGNPDWDYSGSSGTFKTSTGVTTVGGSTTFSKTATFSGESTFNADATVADTYKVSFNNVAGGTYAAAVGLDNASKIQGIVSGTVTLSDASQYQAWGVTFQSAPNVVVSYKGAVTGGTYSGANNVGTTGGSLIGVNGEDVYWIAVGEVQA